MSDDPFIHGPAIALEAAWQARYDAMVEKYEADRKEITAKYEAAREWGEWWKTRANEASKTVDRLEAELAGRDPLKAYHADYDEMRRAAKGVES